MTSLADALVFKIAVEVDELEQVHRLNYRTFVEEIPQYEANEHGVLVDRFDQDNTYFICKRGTRVVGMIAVRDRRPFSIDAKLPELDSYLPAGCTFCEIRLLAVEREHRNGVVFHGLLRELARYCIALGFNATVISGRVRHMSLYEHLGFVPFGPRVGTPEAPYQPMYLTLDAFHSSGAYAISRRSTGERLVPLSFLPGPVDVHPEVRQAYAAPPISHRDAAFITELQRTKQLLCELVHARHVEILLGSGTLANDVVAGQLAALDEPGLVLTNGEFGDRLVDHASRAGLRFDVERLSWGDAFNAATLERVLSRQRGARWCWMVHHETSTGVLNDLAHGLWLCRDRGLKLCSDCVSSIGVVPVDLRQVYLATGVSGKAIGALAGLSLVFHHGTVQRSSRLPRYMDLSLYAEAEGVPFTQPSGLLTALRVATEMTLRRGDLSDLRALSTWLRQQLRALGMRPVAADQVASPGVVTLALDPDEDAQVLGDALAQSGFALSYRSEYLRKRNWIQVALMGECSRQKFERLLHALRQLRASDPSAHSRASRLRATSGARSAVPTMAGPFPTEEDTTAASGLRGTGSD